MMMIMMIHAHLIQVRNAEPIRRPPTVANSNWAGCLVFKGAVSGTKADYCGIGADARTAADARTVPRTRATAANEGC